MNSKTSCRLSASGVNCQTYVYPGHSVAFCQEGMRGPEQAKGLETEAGAGHFVTFVGSVFFHGALIAPFGLRLLRPMG